MLDIEDSYSTLFLNSGVGSARYSWPNVLRYVPCSFVSKLFTVDTKEKRRRNGRNKKDRF